MKNVQCRAQEKCALPRAEKLRHGGQDCCARRDAALQAREKCRLGAQMS